MKDLIKLMWRLKVRTMFYFGLGFGEVSNPVNLVKSVLIIIAGLVYVFKFHISLTATIIISLASFIGCVALGVVLKKTGMADYASKVGNDVNPEMKLIRKIAKHLGINEND